MAHPNPFQPWKFYRKNETDTSTAYNKVKNGDSGSLASNSSIQSHQFEMIDSQPYQIPVTSSSSNNGPNSETDQPSSKPSLNGTKFSIFSQLLNLNKINAFDNLLLMSSMSLEDEELSVDKRQGIRKLMEQAISDEAKQQIAFILEKISVLRPAEKLLLYLKMPGGHSEVDPLKQSQNPLGSRSEISHTINWVRSHLEHDEKVSIPKQEVYEDYVSFCEKINIKPLSTADFGKVMKQVFPDIRPRRLGTRGHSRYCYAAMRKATKLQPPQLSTNCLPKDDSIMNSVKDDSSWNTIKNWSECLLNAQFDSVEDLASHISQNKMSTSSTSKQLLQRKIMQRETKDRKRNNNQSLKKRRVKPRKNLVTPEPLQECDDYFDNNIQIKQEKETDGSNFSEDSSDVPMNLTSRAENESNSSKNQLVVETRYDVETDEISRNRMELKNTTPSTQSSDTNDMSQEDNSFPLCKKVRQAQQLKMTASSANSGIQIRSNSSSVSTSGTEVLHEMIMPSKIPSKRKQTKSISHTKRLKHSDRNESIDQATALQTDQAEPNDTNRKRDDLKEEFIIPRERFISICNMDRNALDTYLNANEENSQDLELLQYFGEDKSKNPEFVEEDLGPASTSVPLLENYQLLSEGKHVERQSEKISQLRTMLEEKHNNSAGINPGSEQLIKNLLQKNCNQVSVDMGNCEQLINYGPTLSSILSTQRPRNIGNFENDSIMNNDNDKFIPQSPNTRRKNFSFVPITSQSSKVKNINLHPTFKGEMAPSPFVSPRVTPVNRRASSFLNIRNPNIDSKSIPVFGTNNTAFCRPHQMKMEPSSAPQSPSIIQSYNYSPVAQQNHFQFQPQGTNYNYPVESRSQSVPPHCTNTNMFNSYNSYSSACSSMAPTPVPSDYQEFSDSNILDIFNSEQSQQPSSTIKLEANEDVINLLENEIMNQSSEGNQSSRQIFLNSRSVPNTPLPYAGNYGNMHSFCPVGKSVPTTPIGTIGPFRYSPELQRTRDFLINGFNNNNNINNNNNNLMNSKMSLEKIESLRAGTADGSLVNDIEELSNLDTSLLNNL